LGKYRFGIAEALSRMRRRGGFYCGLVATQEGIGLQFFRER
jgi:hypothetical protein